MKVTNEENRERTRPEKISTQKMYGSRVELYMY